MFEYTTLNKSIEALLQCSLVPFFKLAMFLLDPKLLAKASSVLCFLNNTARQQIGVAENSHPKSVQFLFEVCHNCAL